MRSSRSFTGTLIVALTVCFGAGSARAQSTFYVDDSATPPGDGTSWETAYSNLRDTLGNATTGDEILVAQGTYTPGTQTNSFELKAGVALRGGYRGCSGLDCSDADQHDVAEFESILSGDIARDDGPDFANNMDNCHHVVRWSGTGDTAVLDGFTVTAGNALDAVTTRVGGGLYSDSGGSLEVTNC
ncbi:MAG: hypothetical protein ACYTFA_14155, partial [Planctomycetota bacterium]